MQGTQEKNEEIYNENLTPYITEDDEEGDLLCQEKYLKFQIHSQDEVDRKHRDEHFS